MLRLSDRADDGGYFQAARVEVFETHLSEATCDPDTDN